MDIKVKIANATPLVVGPVTFYIVSTDLINTGDGGVFINVHTVLENTGSPSSNPDLFCTQVHMLATTILTMGRVIILLNILVDIGTLGVEISKTSCN